MGWDTGYSTDSGRGTNIALAQAAYLQFSSTFVFVFCFIFLISDELYSLVIIFYCFWGADSVVLAFGRWNGRRQCQ